MFGEREIRNVEPIEALWYIITIALIINFFMTTYCYGPRFDFKAINPLAIPYIATIGFGLAYNNNYILSIKPIHAGIYAGIVNAIFVLNFLAALLFCKICKVGLNWKDVGWHLLWLEIHTAITCLCMIYLIREAEE